MLWRILKKKKTVFLGLFQKRDPPPTHPFPPSLLHSLPSLLYLLHIRFFTHSRRRGTEARGDQMLPLHGSLFGDRPLHGLLSAPCLGINLCFQFGDPHVHFADGIIPSHRRTNVRQPMKPIQTNEYLAKKNH